MKVSKEQLNEIIRQELALMLSEQDNKKPGFLSRLFGRGSRKPKPDASAGASMPAQSGFDLTAAGEHEVQPRDVVSSEPAQAVQQTQQKPPPIPGAKQQIAQTKKPVPQQKSKHIPRAGQINVARVVGDGMQQALRTADPRSQKVLDTLRPQITNLVTKFVNYAVKNSGKQGQIKIIQMGYGKQQPSAATKPAAVQSPQIKVAENLEESERIIHDYLLTEFLKLEQSELEEIIIEKKTDSERRGEKLKLSPGEYNREFLKWRSESGYTGGDAKTVFEKYWKNKNNPPTDAPTNNQDTSSVSSEAPPAQGTTTDTGLEAQPTFGTAPEPEPDTGSSISMPVENPPETAATSSTEDKPAPTEPAPAQSAAAEPVKPQRTRSDVVSVEKGDNSLRRQLQIKYGTQLGKEANNALLMIARNIKAELAANGIKVQENKLQETKTLNRWQKLAGIIKG